MAQHIDDVVTADIPKVSKRDFWFELRSGDLIFCQGKEAISVAIESQTKSPFSHVLQTWLPPDLNKWLTLESTFEHGVHVGKLSDYIDSYSGHLVLCRRPKLTLDDIREIQRKFLTILDDGYNWRSEVGIAAHKLLDCLPVIEPKGEYYCSGAQYFASMAVAPALKRPSPLWLPTPEDNYTDPSVEAVCCLLEGSE